MGLGGGEESKADGPGCLPAVKPPGRGRPKTERNIVDVVEGSRNTDHRDGKVSLPKLGP